MTSGILNESALDTIVNALPSASQRAALYTHTFKREEERKEMIGEMERLRQRIETLEGQINDYAARLAQQPAPVVNAAPAVACSDEREAICQIIERHNTGDTVRAIYGRKIAQMLRSGEWN